MYGTFFLGKNPNGKFFVTNNKENVAQQLADETGVKICEIVEDKKGNWSLKDCVLEKGAEKPAEVEIKTLVVDGESVKVQTSTQEAKKKVRAAAEADERVKSAAEQAREKRREKDAE